MAIRSYIIYRLYINFVLFYRDFRAFANETIHKVSSRIISLKSSCSSSTNNWEILREKMTEIYSSKFIRNSNSFAKIGAPRVSRDKYNSTPSISVNSAMEEKKDTAWDENWDSDVEEVKEIEVNEDWTDGGSLEVLAKVEKTELELESERISRTKKREARQQELAAKRKEKKSKENITGEVTSPDSALEGEVQPEVDFFKDMTPTYIAPSIIRDTSQFSYISNETKSSSSSTNITNLSMEQAAMVHHMFFSF